MTIQNGLKLDLRNKPDFRIKLIKHLVTASWVLAIIAFFITCLTLPSIKIFLNNFLKLNLPTSHSQLSTVICLSSIAVTFLASLSGVGLNSTRNRRRGDHFYNSLVVISILSGISIIVWLALV